jgi:hypothetical protein
MCTNTWVKKPRRKKEQQEEKVKRGNREDCKEEVN